MALPLRTETATRVRAGLGLNAVGVDDVLARLADQCVDVHVLALLGGPVEGQFLIWASSGSPGGGESVKTGELWPPSAEGLAEGGAAVDEGVGEITAPKLARPQALSGSAWAPITTPPRSQWNRSAAGGPVRAELLTRRRHDGS